VSRSIVQQTLPLTQVRAQRRDLALNRAGIVGGSNS